ncbi:glycoside hydrolase family 15 protein [Halomicrobium salinisoli]|uniref:glycoside hydrolase family 15 protein n=1 Tax=Halomicrobium salinisoli TaxID=2878391 RepID=UPI001CEFD905|nr:glycoside hydrolase family 15 protein [Halomicrobium salinisoli]
MTMRTALNDFKRRRGDDDVVPGELRTTTGTFAGDGDRLVHVDDDGSLRDYSYPLAGLGGIDRSRFGVGEAWFDAGTDQRYLADTGVVETVHELDGYRVRQRDLTAGRLHVTRFDCEGDAPAAPVLRAYVGFAPEGRESQISHLVHDGAVEAYHRREHDYVGVSTELGDVRGQVPERFPELVGDDPVAFPRETETQRYEDAVMTGDLLLSVPFEDGGVTLVTLLAERDETTREAALARVGDAVETHDSASALERAGERQRDWPVPESPPAETVVDDLRVLSLLSAPNGARIAGPDFDPFYVGSGGYGYTWFRDDAEIARFLLDADEALDVALDDWHRRSAAFYVRSQRADGSWPHRVWPGDETLAPGWANARLAAGNDTDYQADQTASVVAFLARYLRARDPADPGRIEAAIDRAVDSVDGTLADDGLPVACQNAWEDGHGRFVHTAATFLHAYAAVARAPVDADLRERARAQADAVLAGLDRLWTGEHYAVRERDGDLDERIDSGSLALAGALREYDAVADLDAATVDRLVTHVETTLSALERETEAVSGLVRYEGDEWRTGPQDGEKVWTVSTAWGANAAAELGSLLAERGDDPADAFRRSRDLLAELTPGGSLVRSNGYLPEQRFDDGTPDSATPLGWPHALRLATVAHLASEGELAR